MSDPAAVYRFFDADDRLLYIGLSGWVFSRTMKHSCTKPWFKCVSRIELEWFDTREDAANAEIEAIRKEDPIHNVEHRILTGRKRGPHARFE